MELYKNNFNDCYYYGCHSTNKLDDNYMGGGTRLNNSYKKYRKENFKMEKLKNFDNARDMLSEEELLVTFKEIKDPLCYNIILGGKQVIGYRHTEEAKKKISNAYSNKSSRLGKKNSKEHKEKNRIASIGNRHGEGYTHTKEAKRKIREASKSNDHALGSKRTKEQIRNINCGQTKNIGYFINTPFGDFSSISKAAQFIGVSTSCVYNWISNPDKIITNSNGRMPFQLKLLSPIGRTSKELGFRKLPVYLIDCNYFDIDGKNISYATFNRS